jgi:tetratricopeptide (TPR) repeat protein
MTKQMSVFKETLNMQRQCLGEEHIDLALTLESIGKIYEDNQRIDRALRCFYKALNIRDSVAPNSLELALIVDKIGNCQIQINGDIREAMTCFEEAIKLYRLNGLDNNDPRLCNARKNFVSTVQAVERERREKDDELIGRDITI